MNIKLEMRERERARERGEIKWVVGWLDLWLVESSSPRKNRKPATLSHSR